jgi:hypothetical protein
MFFETLPCEVLFARFYLAWHVPAYLGATSGLVNCFLVYVFFAAIALVTLLVDRAWSLGLSQCRKQAINVAVALTFCLPSGDARQPSHEALLSLARDLAVLLRESLFPRRCGGGSRLVLNAALVCLAGALGVCYVVLSFCGLALTFLSE